MNRVVVLAARTCGLPDQWLDHLPLVELSQAVESVLDELRPRVVYSHFSGDVNLDHVVVRSASNQVRRLAAEPFQLMREVW
jgi:LmbE family N-acetylglucosaminyl deacetylase